VNILNPETIARAKYSAGIMRLVNIFQTNSYIPGSVIQYPIHQSITLFKFHTSKKKAKPVFILQIFSVYLHGYATIYYVQVQEACLPPGLLY